MAAAGGQSRRGDGHRRRPAAAKLGYTVVEVMMALAVLAIGATGIIAMQKTTLIGSVRARDLAVANAIAASWIERLRLDAVQWTDADGTPNLNQTRWLKAVGQDFPNVQDPEGIWFQPADEAGFHTYAQADVRGADTPDPADAGFCTHLRLTQLAPNLIRAEVRVFWLRSHALGGASYGGTIGGQPLCTDNPAYVNQVGVSPERYHFVYLSTGILRNAVN